MLNDALSTDEQINWSFLRNISENEIISANFLIGLSTSQFYHRDKFLLSLYQFLKQQKINYLYFFPSNFLDLYNIAIEEQCSEELVLELEKGPHQIEQNSPPKIFAFKQKALTKQKQWEEENKEFMSLLQKDGLESHFLDLNIIIKDSNYEFIKQWHRFKNKYSSVRNDSQKKPTNYKIAIDKEAKHYLKRRKISYIEASFKRKIEEIFGDKKISITDMMFPEFIALNQQLKKIQLQADAIYGTDTALKCAVLYKIAETTLFYCITRKHNIKYFIYPGKISPAVASLRKRFIVGELGEDMFQWLGVESQALTNVKSIQKEKLGAFLEGDFLSDGSDSDASIAELNLINDSRQSLTPRNSPSSSPSSSPKKLSRFKEKSVESTTDEIPLNNNDMSLLETYVWATGISQLAKDAQRLNVSAQVIVELCKKLPQEQSAAIVEKSDKHLNQTVDYSKNPFTLLPSPRVNNHVDKVNTQIISIGAPEAIDSTRSNCSSSSYSVALDLDRKGTKLPKCNIM